MLLKCMHTEGHTTFDKVSDLHVLTTESATVTDDTVQQVYYPDPVLAASVTEARRVLVTRNGEPDMLIRSQHPMYLMNDEGRTIEVIKPQ